MPATGTPEPGGLSWYEMLALLRATMARRTVVACDVVELSPMPGLVAPNFLCAKLIYKILGYRFARREWAVRRQACSCIRGILPAVASSDLYAQAQQALDRGQGAEAATLLSRLLKRPGLPRNDQIQIRCALAEAWLLQDDVRQATGARWAGRRRHASGSSPTELSHLWRMHGRLASARGEPSRGIAFLTKAVSQAERAHDSRAIGLAHYELGPLLPAGRRHRHRPRAHHPGGVGAARRRRPASPGDGPLALRHHAGAGRPARRSDGRAAPRRAAGAAGRRGRRARDGLRQPGERRADAASPRAGADAGRAERRAAGRSRDAARPRRRAGVARPDLRAARQPDDAPRRRSTARSTCAARSSSCARRPARCSTRWRRFT